MNRFIFVFLIVMNGLVADEWNRVYLATYPRSGNHWIRNLIEEATHIATGSVYQDKDPIHMPEIFSWGGYSAKNGCIGTCRYPKKGDIVAIKTHFPALEASRFDQLNHTKVVRIVRHPLDSFYSYYYYHKEAPSVKYIPYTFVKEKIKEWKEFQNYWNREKNVLTIRYEDLLENPQKTLKAVLDYIGYKVKEKDIERAVAKFPPIGQPMKHFNSFSPASLKLTENKLKNLLVQFHYTLDNK